MKIKNFRKLGTAILFSFILILCVFAFTASAEVVFFEDFTNHTVDQKPATIDGVEQELTDFARVVSDNGNNVLVIGKKKGSNAGVTENILLDKEYKNGVYIFSYKFKPKNHYTHAVNFMRLMGSDNKSINADTLASNYYWFSHTVSNGSTTVDAHKISQVTDYITVTTIVDFNKKTYSTTAVKDGVTKRWGKTFTSENVTKFNTYFAPSNAHGGSGDPNLDSEYYIDDIKVEHFPILVINKMNDTLISDVNQNIEITFDQELKDVNKDRIEIYKDGSTEKLESSLYNVSYSDKKIIVTFVDGLYYGSSYEIKLGKGISAVLGNYDPMIGSTIATFKTPDIYDGVLSVSDNGKYNEPHIFTLTTAHDYSLTLKKDGNEIPFSNNMVLEKGDYTLDIEIWTTSAPDRKYQKTIIFEVFEETAPVFEELKITGDPKVGETLGIDYKYADYNGASEGVHEFYWLKSTDGANFTRVSETSMTSYLLEEKDINCYFKLEAYPVALTGILKGEKHETDVFTGPFKPTVKGDVTLSLADKTITVNYEYDDMNGYPENGTTYQWYRVSSLDDANPVAITGATSIDYTFTDDDVDKYVYCVVIPKKEFKPYGDNEYKSEVISCLKKPVATYVGITGTAVVGSSLAVSYTYDDAEDDPIDKMIFEWYVNGSKYSESEAITLTSSMAGKSVYCVVTPVSQKFPFKGNSVTTETKYVSGSTSSLGGGSYSSGGGGSIGAGSYKDTEKVTEIVTTPTKPNENNTETKNEFSDIHNHWSKENVKRAVDLGFVNGKSENEFSPDTNITRAEFATIIVRVLKLEMKKSDFIDISSDFWYNEYIGAVSSAGYMNGADGMFRPDDNITREEMCKVITNITGISEEIKEADFSDYENISDWAKQAVSKAYELGIVNGRNDGNFSPKDNSTRAEAVSVILRLYDYMKEAE